MQSQPVITEEVYTRQKTNQVSISQNKHQHQVPQTSNKKNPISGQTFFQVMDIIDEYDQMLKQMNDLYTEGIMAIAHVKFINPYTSLSTKGYKPTPAITKLQIRQNEEFSLVSCLNSDFNFTNSVIESIQNEKQQFEVNVQNDSQEQVISQANSSLSTAHQLYSFDEEQLIMQEQQTVQQCRNLIQSKKLSKEDFIMERFSLLNQQSIAAQAMQNFTTLLNKLLEIAQFKLKINSKFKQIQQNST